MCEKRWCSEDVEEQVTRDPHRMVKADCLKPHSQSEEHDSHRYNISNSMPSCTEDFRAILWNLQRRERMAMSHFKGMYGRTSPVLDTYVTTGTRDRLRVATPMATEFP